MKTISSKKSASLSSLANIGPVTVKKLNRIGIFSRDEFLARDPYDVFETLREKVDPTLCRCALASIVGAKLGLPWHQITRATAKEYKKRYPGHVWGKC